jgi:hypothetical protein
VPMPAGIALLETRDYGDTKLIFARVG